MLQSGIALRIFSNSMFLEMCDVVFVVFKLVSHFPQIIGDGLCIAV